ncbi:MAG: hypothetical protein IPO61_16630 [Gammaproteobacteria bacterium]|nr:hypothetical protein [Gammaproteobacteria bacterium]
MTGDAGQLMSRGAERPPMWISRLLHIGDIHWDLACFRGRHPYENMGDIPALYRHYEKASGTKLNLPVINYHTASFLLFAAIAAKAFMEPDARDLNRIEGVSDLSCARRALESIAELEESRLTTTCTFPRRTLISADTGLQNSWIDIERFSRGCLCRLGAWHPWRNSKVSAEFIPATEVGSRQRPSRTSAA